MPRGTRIAPADRHNWLEQYEQGSRIDKIARESGRTQRTINEHIARARREIQQKEVTAGLLTQAYQKHYSQLLKVAEAIGQAAQKANADGILGAADLETQILYQGLRAHIPRNQLWRAIKTWEESSLELDRDSQRRRSTIMSLLAKDSAEWPEIQVEGFVQSFCNAALRVADGRSFDLTEYRVEASEESSQLRWSNFLLADGVPSQRRLEEIQQRHQKLVQNLIGPEVIAPLVSLMARWQSARDVIQEEVVVLRLRQMIPGQCRLCPGGEAPSSIQSRNRRSND